MCTILGPFLRVCVGHLNSNVKPCTQCRISPTLGSPQNAYRGPLMVVYKKVNVMLHLEVQWTSKQNIVIAETILAEPGP